MNGLQQKEALNQLAELPCATPRSAARMPACRILASMGRPFSSCSGVYDSSGVSACLPSPRARKVLEVLELNEENIVHSVGPQKSKRVYTLKRWKPKW